MGVVGGDACLLAALVDEPVIGRSLDGSEDAHRSDPGVGIAQTREREGLADVSSGSVVDHDSEVTLRHIALDGEDPGRWIPHYGQGPVRTEANLVAIHQGNPPACLLLGILQMLEGAVVEDVAVLIDLDQRRPTMSGRRAQHLSEVLAIRVHRPCDEGRLCTERQRHGVERLVERSARSRLRDLADLGGG